MSEREILFVWRNIDISRVTLESFVNNLCGIRARFVEKVTTLAVESQPVQTHIFFRVPERDALRFALYTKNFTIDLFDDLLKKMQEGGDVYYNQDVLDRYIFEKFTL